jgi:hypothetical protein
VSTSSWWKVVVIMEWTYSCDGILVGGGNFHGLKESYLTTPPSSSMYELCIDENNSFIT